MKFYDINNKTPKNGQWCVIKEKSRKPAYFQVLKSLGVFGGSCLQQWWDDSRFVFHPNVVAWAPVPEHICYNPEGWFSEYRGDDLPNHNCACLVCTDKSKVVQYAYFHDGKFLGHPDVVAFMEI